MQRAIVIYGDKQTGAAIADGMASADLVRAREEADFWRMSAKAYRTMYAEKNAEIRRRNMRAFMQWRKRYERKQMIFKPIYWAWDRLAIACYLIQSIVKKRETL